MVVDRHKLTVFYLKSFDMDSVRVGKAVFGKEIYTTLGIDYVKWQKHHFCSITEYHCSQLFKLWVSLTPLGSQKLPPPSTNLKINSNRGGAILLM